MKTIAVISDTHGYSYLHKVKTILSESDYIVHCGDGCGDIRSFGDIANKAVCVTGNCDLYSAKLKSEEILEIEGHKILITHGDKYGVKYSLTPLIKRAKELGCDCVLFGHTHISLIENIDGVLAINPGSCSIYSSEPSYCYIVVTENKIVPTIVKI